MNVNKMWNFRKLDVWKKALNLAKNIYEITDTLPEKEVFGLCSQLRRASVSISSNIAEGCGRRTSKDFIGFLHNATGSTKEVESELLVAEKLGYFESNKINEIIKELDEIGKMLNGLIGHVSELNIR